MLLRELLIQFGYLAWEGATTTIWREQVGDMLRVEGILWDWKRATQICILDHVRFWLSFDSDSPSQLFNGFTTANINLDLYCAHTGL
jgi:hypothetical protein